MEEVFGSPGKAALRLFLDTLPSDATINWTCSSELLWAPTALLAMQLQEELADAK